MHKKRLAIASALLLFAYSTGGQAVAVPWTASLDGAQVPFGTPGTGTASGTYDPDTHVLTWEVEVSGLLGAATAAHFHGPAAPGASAGIRVEPPTLDLGTLAGSSAGGFAGSRDLDDLPVPPSPGAAVLENELLSGLWYLNIHTSVAAGGEIRGQVNVIPVPAAAWLLGSALVGLAGHCGRRRRPAVVT
jgi:hypothetical protein